MVLCCLETPSSLDRAAFCQDVVIEYFGKAVESSFMEEYFKNDTTVAVSKRFSHRASFANCYIRLLYFTLLLELERGDNILLLSISHFQLVFSFDFIRALPVN